MEARWKVIFFFIRGSFGRCGSGIDGVGLARPTTTIYHQPPTSRGCGALFTSVATPAACRRSGFPADRDLAGVDDQRRLSSRPQHRRAFNIRRNGDYAHRHWMVDWKANADARGEDVTSQHNRLVQDVAVVELGLPSTTMTEDWTMGVAIMITLTAIASFVPSGRSVSRRMGARRPERKLIFFADVA